MPATSAPAAPAAAASSIPQSQRGATGQVETGPVLAEDEACGAFVPHAFKPELCKTCRKRQTMHK